MTQKKGETVGRKESAKQIKNNKVTICLDLPRNWLCTTRVEFFF